MNRNEREISFINRSLIKHNNEYDYSLVNYKNNKTKVKIICPKHGIFEQRPDDHLNGRGCNICGGSIKSNNNIFIEKSKDIHGDLYDYSLVNYKNNKIKVKIICSKHGIFEQTPSTHIYKKYGCPECNLHKRKSKYSFIEDSIEIHGDRYDYSLVDYKNNRIKVKIICKEHGVFEQLPKLHIYRKYGCPKCNSSKGENKIELLLNELNIEYVNQKTFSDCKYKSLLKFDFYLPKYNTCIEYDGIQHYKPLDFFGGIKEYNKTIKRDKIKNNYCKDNNIKLIRIKYNEDINKIKKEIK